MIYSIDSMSLFILFSTIQIKYIGFVGKITIIYYKIWMIATHVLLKCVIYFFRQEDATGHYTTVSLVGIMIHSWESTAELLPN